MDCYMKRYGSLPIIYDSFDRANGYLGNAGTGQAWLTGGAATTEWVVSSNVAKRVSVNQSVSSVAYIDCGKSDVVVSADITLTNYSYGSRLIARMSGTDVNNSIGLAIAQDGNVVIVRYISGSGVALGTGTFSYSSGATYKCVLSCIGNDFTASIDGVVKVSVTNDNALKTNTKVGMFLPLGSSAAFDWFDNFLVR